MTHTIQLKLIIHLIPQTTNILQRTTIIQVLSPTISQDITITIMNMM